MRYKLNKLPLWVLIFLIYNRRFFRNDYLLDRAFQGVWVILVLFSIFLSILLSFLSIFFSIVLILILDKELHYFFVFTQFFSSFEQSFCKLPYHQYTVTPFLFVTLFIISTFLFHWFYFHWINVEKSCKTLDISFMQFLQPHLEIWLMAYWLE